eukprot:SAG22_NODE_444_length_10453_cov_8.586343_7_plen_604_part_00
MTAQPAFARPWCLLHVLFRDSLSGVIVAVGSDYRFMNASVMFDNMAKVHAEINANQKKYGMRVRHTTLSQYADHVHSLNFSFPVWRWPTDFEYGWPHGIPVPLDGKPIPPSSLPPWPQNDTTQYQTGAPVSRAAFKQRAREVSALHHAAEVAHALAVAAGKMRANASALFPAWDALGIVQHHDAMPGTMSTRGTFTAWGGATDQAPEHGGNVACGVGARYLDTDCLALEDYFRRLDEGANVSAAVLGQALSALAASDAEPTASKAAATYTPEDGRSTQNEDIVLVFNPLGHARSAVAQAMLPEHLKVPAGHAPPEVLTRPSGSAVSAQMAEDGMSLHFLAAVPAGGLRQFTLTAATPARSTRWPNVTRGAPAAAIRNAALELTFGTHGGLASITNIKDAATVKTEQSYYNYETSVGGPYVLVERAQATALPPPSTVRTVAGPVFTEVVATFQNWGSPSATLPGPKVLTQTTRLIHGNTDVVEVAHGIPVMPEDRELISRIDTDLGSDTLWNDDTGLELYPRPFNVTLPISANYHSLVNSGVLKSEESTGHSQRQLAVLTRHTMGIASLAPGSLEYMMMRRISGADNQGPCVVHRIAFLSSVVF